MITFQEESYLQLFTPEFMDMYKEHWREIGIFDKDKIKLSPDWDAYKTLGKANALKLFLVRNNDVTVGYAIFIVVNHPHYKTVKVAENDIIYIKKEFRKGLTGYKFIKYCKEKLKDKVGIITLSMKANRSFLPITERLGFKLTDYKLTLET